MRLEHPRRTAPDGAEPSAAVAARVARAWGRQRDRQGMANAGLPLSGLEANPALPSRIVTLVARRGEKFRLSPRRLHRAMRLALTIADLDGADAVAEEHVDEALFFRPEAAT